MPKSQTSSEKPVVLVTVSGQDAPGITAEMTSVLAEAGANILDIGQASIHGWLSLSILFEMLPHDQQEKATVKDLLFRANELKLKLDFHVFDAETAAHGKLHSRIHLYAVTLIADPVTAKALHHVTMAMAKHNLNIDLMQRLSEQNFNCVEMVVSSEQPIDQTQLRKELLQIAMDEGVDIALQAEGLFRRAKRMVVLDMDSTLIQNEVIDEVAREYGVFEEVSQITEEAMKGQLDFNESLKKRCALLKGFPVKKFDDVYEKLKLTPGAKELILVLKKLGYKTAVISGGFSCIAERFREQLGIDYVYSNNLEVKDGKLTGNVLPPIVNAQRKADLLDMICQQEKIQLSQVIAIGDGANDVLMLEKAGLGIAFNAKPVLKSKADFALSKINLSSVLHILGISGRDVSELLKQ